VIERVGQKHSIEEIEAMLTDYDWGVLVLGNLYIFDDPPHGIHPRFELHCFHEKQGHFGKEVTSEYLLSAPTLEKLVRLAGISLNYFSYVTRQEWQADCMSEKLGMQYYNRLFPIKEELA